MTDEIIVREHADLLTAIRNCELQKKEIEKQEKAMRELLMKTMEDHGVWDVDFEDSLSITRIPAGEQKRLDSERLKAELPLIAEEYSKVVPVKSSIRISIKKEKKA